MLDIFLNGIFERCIASLETYTKTQGPIVMLLSSQLSILS